MQLKFLDIVKFHVGLLQVWDGQKSEIWTQISMQLKFLNFSKFNI